ncbi:MAG: rhodanese-like domain-containing protein, partial [Syntrophomonadaceae bacterium]|nr:rhodanese-like domain-containing protein [Syntrophomonadaceae bacterium]
MARRFLFKWLSLLLMVILFSSLVVGCNTDIPANSNSGPDVEQNEPAPIPATTNPIEEMADKYFAKMPYHIYKISEQDLKYRVDVDDADTLIIDIRVPEDYAKGHIKGATNIPFSTMYEYLDKLPVDKEIIVYCYTGEMAGQAVAILNMYGYNAKSLNSGFDRGWVKNYNFLADTEVYGLPTGVTPA